MIVQAFVRDYDTDMKISRSDKLLGLLCRLNGKEAVDVGRIATGRGMKNK